MIVTKTNPLQLTTLSKNDSNFNNTTEKFFTICGAKFVTKTCYTLYTYPHKSKNLHKSTF